MFCRCLLRTTERRGASQAPRYSRHWKVLPSFLLQVLLLVMPNSALYLSEASAEVNLRNIRFAQNRPVRSRRTASARSCLAFQRQVHMSAPRIRSSAQIRHLLTLMFLLPWKHEEIPASTRTPQSCGVRNCNELKARTEKHQIMPQQSFTGSLNNRR
jgi:hypothetical protein